MIGTFSPTKIARNRMAIRAQDHMVKVYMGHTPARDTRSPMITMHHKKQPREIQRSLSLVLQRQVSVQCNERARVIMLREFE
mmetsp:Transcript_44375/g.140013  ORF Transcript_44375/g.140013 Transcript_44375/m.140013 type:complete len:82 (-) Transcript_44375:468-713(-)